MTHSTTKSDGMCFFALTDLHLTRNAPTPRARRDNPRPRLTMVPRVSPQKPLGPVDHGAEAAANPATGPSTNIDPGGDFQGKTLEVAGLWHGFGHGGTCFGLV